MAEGLKEYLAQARDCVGSPFVWGQSDCTIWCADWCFLRFGFDPADGIRGTYVDEEGALAVFGGDLVAFVGPRLGRLRIKADADDGDVAIVRAFGRDVAAVRVSPFWAIKTENGLAMVRARSIRIWGN